MLNWPELPYDLNMHIITASSIELSCGSSRRLQGTLSLNLTQVMMP